MIYVSGISLAILSYADRQAAVELLGTLKTKVAFDPNIRPALWKSMDEARHTFEAMVKVASIVLPSRQDYQLMYGMDDPQAQIEFTATLTEAEIALTCDEDGCRLRVGDEIIALPTQAVKVVDTSGAGDSFNGAYLAARLKGRAPRDAVKDGLALAAKVVAQPGAIIPRPDLHPRLPSSRLSRQHDLRLRSQNVLHDIALLADTGRCRPRPCRRPTRLRRRWCCCLPRRRSVSGMKSVTMPSFRLPMRMPRFQPG